MAPVLLENPIFLWFFRGVGASDPLSSDWILTWFDLNILSLFYAHAYLIKQAYVHNELGRSDSHELFMVAYVTYVNTDIPWNFAAQ